MSDAPIDDEFPWRTPIFIKNVAAQLDESIRAAGILTGKTGSYVESLIFAKVKDKEKYLAAVYKVIEQVPLRWWKRPKRLLVQQEDNSADELIDALQNLDIEGGIKPPTDVASVSPQGPSQGPNATPYMEAWLTPTQRERVAAKIEQEIQSANIRNTLRTGSCVESHFFVKSEGNKDRYFGCIGRFILHCMEYGWRQEAARKPASFGLDVVDLLVELSTLMEAPDSMGQEIQTANEVNEKSCGSETRPVESSLNGEFRQRIITKLHKEFKGKSGSSRICADMEGLIFKKATTTEDYLDSVARIIICVRDMIKAKISERDEDFWRAPTYRLRAVEKIDKALAVPSIGTLVTSINIEDNIFRAAEDWNHYKQLLAKRLSNLHIMVIAQSTNTPQSPLAVIDNQSTDYVMTDESAELNTIRDTRKAASSSSRSQRGRKWPL